jgi:glutaredoxin 3
MAGTPSEARVVVYVTTYCPYCDRAKNLLKKKGIAYQSVDVTGDDAKRAWLVQASGGRRTVPQIFIDGKPVGGSDELHALDRAGELDKMMAKTPAVAAS